MMRLLAPVWALFVALTLISSAATAAMADDLDTYRADGSIIERFDGYVEAASGASAAAVALVAEVNARRKAVYEKRAAENGAPVSEVGKIYAAQIFEQAPAGTYFRKEDGSVVRK